MACGKGWCIGETENSLKKQQKPQTKQKAKPPPTPNLKNDGIL